MQRGEIKPYFLINPAPSCIFKGIFRLHRCNLSVWKDNVFASGKYNISIETFHKLWQLGMAQVIYYVAARRKPVEKPSSLLLQNYFEVTILDHNSNEIV